MPETNAYEELRPESIQSFHLPNVKINLADLRFKQASAQKEQPKLISPIHSTGGQEDGSLIDITIMNQASFTGCQGRFSFSDRPEDESVAVQSPFKIAELPSEQIKTFYNYETFRGGQHPN